MTLKVITLSIKEILTKFEVNTHQLLTYDLVTLIFGLLTFRKDIHAQRRVT